MFASIFMYIDIIWVGNLVVFFELHWTLSQRTDDLEYSGSPSVVLPLSHSLCLADWIFRRFLVSWTLKKAGIHISTVSRRSTRPAHLFMNERNPLLEYWRRDFPYQIAYLYSQLLCVFIFLRGLLKMPFEILRILRIFLWG